MREGHSAATEHTMHHQHDARLDDAGEAAGIGTDVLESHAHGSRGNLC